MKIRCKIRRKAGSSVTLDGVTYHWNDENDHVCDVDNKAHAQRLLDVPSAFVAESAQRAAKAEAPGDDGEDSSQDGAQNSAEAESKPARRGGRRAAKTEAPGEQ